MADQHRNELVQMIPERYTSIGDVCFKNNGKMKEIWLPLGCKVIGREAFYGCHIRNEVILPGRLTEIRAGAFAGNCNLPRTDFPASLEKLGKQCYKDCNNLKSVRFASGSRCTEIPEIHHDPEEIGPGIVNKSCTIRCRKGSRMDAYCEENGLKTEYIDER